MGEIFSSMNDIRNKKSFLEVVAYTTAFIGFAILGFLLFKSYCDGIRPFGKIDFELSSRFGDFVAGTVGTLFAFAGTLFIFLTFREQQVESKRKQFEEVYYEMIRIHRENVEQLIYVKQDDKSERVLSNRLVVKEIINEYLECYKEVKKLLKHTDIQSKLKDGYKKHIKNVNRENGINASPNLHFYIDLCYNIVYFGVGEEGQVIIKEKFKRIVDTEIIITIIFYLQLKPKKSNEKRNRLWKDISVIESKGLYKIIEEGRKIVKGQYRTTEKSTSKKIADSFKNKKYKKYYGGHQHRLGHYFRHLYQSFKLLDKTQLIKEDDKYDYGKILRVQLSTYEQMLLFVNSVSSLGKKWEFIKDEGEKKNNYITKYQLIKNVPGPKLLDVKYRTFYPKTRLESMEQRF